MLFESIIADKTLNIDDIVIGDKNAIVLASYFRLWTWIQSSPNEYGENEDVTIDLSKVQTKDIDYDKLKEIMYMSL